jgi:hypothetical protein
MRSDKGTKVAQSENKPVDQQFMVGKYIMFFEDLMPRDTMFIEEAVYVVEGIKGTQQMLIKPAYLPFKAEVKNRTKCLPGLHIAVITDSLEKAQKVVDIVTKLKKNVDQLGDFATSAINGYRFARGEEAVASVAAELRAEAGEHAIVSTVSAMPNPSTDEVRVRVRVRS